MNDEEFENLFRDSNEVLLNSEDESLSILSSMMQEDAEPILAPKRSPTKKISFSNLPAPEYVYSQPPSCTANNMTKRIREESMPRKEFAANRQVTQYNAKPQEIKKNYDFFATKNGTMEHLPKKQKIETNTNNNFIAPNQPSQPQLSQTAKPMNTLSSTGQPNAEFAKSLEFFSGIVLQSRTVTIEEMKMALHEKKLIKLSQFSQAVQGKGTLMEEIKQHDWVTIAIVGTKSDAKTTKTGSAYAIWGLYNLSNASIQLFLFGSSFEEHEKMEIGSVILLLNPRVDPSKSKEGGIVFTASHSQQLYKIGTSADFAFCTALKADKTPCNAIMNKRMGRCEFHLKKAFNEKRSERSVIANSPAGNKKQGLTTQNINLSRNRQINARHVKKLQSTNFTNNEMKKRVVNKEYEKVQKPEPPKIDPLGHGQGSRYVKASQGVFEDSVEAKLQKKRQDLHTKVISPLTKLQSDEITYSGIIHPYSHVLYTKTKSELSGEKDEPFEKPVSNDEDDDDDEEVELCIESGNNDSNDELLDQLLDG
jgi:hypothetical protein